MSTTTKEDDQYRLPTNIKATHYDLLIQTDLERLTFQALVKIRWVLSPTYSLLLTII